LKLWWLVDVSRFAREKAAVEGLEKEGWFKLDRWQAVEARLNVFGTIVAHGHGYLVRLVYPDQFPSVPAFVLPQENVKWSPHQYGEGGSLCLELRPDNWLSVYTGADMLRSAYHLLEEENPLGEGQKGSVESAHRVGAIQTYSSYEVPVLIGAGCLERVRGSAAEDLRGFYYLFTEDTYPILVHDAVDRASPGKPPGADIKVWRMEIPVIVANAIPPAEKPADRAALMAAAALDEEATKAAKEGGLLVLFVAHADVVPYFSPSVDKAFRRRLFLLPDEQGVRSGRADASKSKRIAIVGAGSVGSKLAESLVRAGIQSLLLVDGDVFLPANIERNALDWRDVGFRKVDALKRRLLHVAPGAKISVITSNLNWQRSASSHAKEIEQIAASDIIVDCTADAGTVYLLGALAAENQRTLVSVEVFDGGFGALVAACLPGREPPYAEARAAYTQWCETQGVAAPPRGNRPYEALSDGDVPMVADDAAVAVAAAHAARVVLDVADERPPEHQAAWLLIGLRKAWLFEGHGHIVWFCPEKSSPTPEAPADPEAIAFALAIAREAMREGPSQT